MLKKKKTTTEERKTETTPTTLSIKSAYISRMKSKWKQASYEKKSRLCIAPCSMCVVWSKRLYFRFHLLCIWIYIHFTHLESDVALDVGRSNSLLHFEKEKNVALDCWCMFQCIVYFFREIQMAFYEVHSQCAHVFKNKVKILLRCIEMISWMFGLVFFCFVSSRNGCNQNNRKPLCI